MEITKRNFLRLGALFGVGAALPAFAREKVLKPKEEAPPPKGEETFANTVCGMCPAGCGLRIRLVDGHPVGVSGLLDHPVNHGGLCPKGAASLQEFYHPDRLRGPVVRKGSRGSGNWESISWEEAFRLVAEKILKAEFGKGKPPLLAVTAKRGADVPLKLLKELAGKDNVRFWGLPASSFPEEAFQSMHGTRTVACNLLRAKLIVSFGFDWLQAHPSHVEAQRVLGQFHRGGSGRAQIVQIEPRFSITAAKSNQWIPIRPGTHGILALGIARRLIENGTYDEDFIGRRAQGFEAFQKSLEPFTAERVSEITGVPSSEILLLAVKMWRLRPAVVMTCRDSALDQMAVHSLNALLGSLDKGIFTGADPDVDSSLPAANPGGSPPDVLLLDRINPAFAAPASWKSFLDRTPFVATVSSFISETAQLSDLVLPSHTPLERTHGSCHALMEGGWVLNAAAPVTTPLYNTKDPADIFLSAAQAMERVDRSENLHSYVERFIKQAGGTPAESVGGRWREFPAPGEPLRFPTRSGKFEFDPLAKLIDGGEWRTVLPADEDKDFPLGLCLFTPLAFSNGKGAHLPYLQSLVSVQSQKSWETWAEIHPETARLCGVSEGDAIVVESRRGKARAQARLLSSAMPGVVSIPFGLGHTAYGRWAEGVGSNPAELVDSLEAAEVFRSWTGTRVRLKRT